MFPGFIVSLINLVIGLIELLLAIRLLLRLFAANPATPFVRWTYETSQPLVNPFLGIFPNPVLTGGLVIEFSTLVALVVYAIAGYVLAELIGTLGYGARRRTIVEER
ncbi:MAG: YggT family protein [Candidatus Blackburnbacteria bacterium]|nr:YggT family protein [Candidatus Blackburnbacteria bacterium]